MATSMHKAQVHLFCKLCENERAVNWKCLECEDLLCNECKKVHQKLSTTKNHKVVSIKEIKTNSSQENKEHQATCQQHNKTCKLFCEECNSVICKKCSSTEHSDHKVNKISKVRKETEENVEELRKIVKSRQNMYEELRKEKSKARRQIETEMKMRHKTLTASINKRYESLQKELGEHFDNLDKNLKIWQDNEGFPKLKAKQSELEKLLGESDILALVKQFKKMQEHVNHMLMRIPLLERVVFEPGQMSHDQLSREFGYLHFPDTKTLADVESLEIVKQVETDFERINLVCPIQDDLIWISDYGKNVLQLVERGNLLNPINQISMNIEDGCVLGDQLFVSDWRDQVIKRITLDGTVNIVKEMRPLTPLCIYVMSSGDIIVGERESSEEDTPNTDKCRVKRITMSGETKQEFEYDKRGLRLFKSPIRCTMDEKNEDIFILDCLDQFEGRLICITRTGSVKFKYHGNLSLNLPDPFSPSDISYFNDVVFINDYVNNGMHLLTSNGDLSKYISYTDFDIQHPLSSEFDENGQLWLGSVQFSDEKAKIYHTILK